MISVNPLRNINTSPLSLEGYCPKGKYWDYQHKINNDIQQYKANVDTITTPSYSAVSSLMVNERGREHFWGPLILPVVWDLNRKKRFGTSEWFVSYFWFDFLTKGWICNGCCNGRRHSPHRLLFRMPTMSTFSCSRTSPSHDLKYFDTLRSN